MKLPIVKRSSRENPVSAKEISALYQSRGSAVTTRAPSPGAAGAAAQPGPVGRGCCFPMANSKSPAKKGSGVLHRLPWSLGPRAHPEHGSPRTQRWAGSEPSALSQYFLFGKRRGGSQPPAFSSMPPPHAPENIRTSPAPKNSGSDARSLLAEQKLMDGTPDLAIALPPKEHRAGKKTPKHTETPKHTHKKFPA